ncbi:MAG: cation diffusion facilitator family transporter [Campylobacterota bacterium]|nr:cation diffusion facilitator family transporter [Campylobacterota bacterium]
MRLEKRATVVSTSVATLLVIIKMVIGIMSGSVAVLASAIDSFLDLCVSIFNFFALHTSEKKADDQFNFGRSKIEPLASVIEGTIISISGLFIFYEAMVKIIHTRETEYLNASIGVMIVSIVLTAALVMYLNYVAKKTDNMVIRADALHYKTDLYTNAAILLALVLISYTSLGIIDPLLGIAIAIYMIYSAYPIIKEGILMLLDAALEEEDVNKIIDLLKNEKRITDYHFLKTRVSGSEIFISVHVVFTVSILLYDAHHISDDIELEIDNLFPDKDVHSIIHLDPYDDSEINEDEY